MSDPLQKIWITDQERLKQLEHKLSQRGKAKDNQLNNDILAAAKKYAAENQRLREALQQLADKVDAYRNGHGFVGADLILATEQARAALAQPVTRAATKEQR